MRKRVDGHRGLVLAVGSHRRRPVAVPNVQFHMVPRDAGHLKRIDQEGDLSRGRRGI